MVRFEREECRQPGFVTYLKSDQASLTVCAVLIVSYERLRMLNKELGQTEIGLLLADEGHRLKNSGSSFIRLART